MVGVEGALNRVVGAEFVDPTLGGQPLARNQIDPVRRWVVADPGRLRRAHKGSKIGTVPAVHFGDDSAKIGGDYLEWRDDNPFSD